MDYKYYLAIETKPKNYFPINLLDLKIANNYNTIKLDELDAFTIKFTKKEIIDAIKEANLLEVDYNMPLIVIYYEKKVVRKIDALTRDINSKFNMWEFLESNYQDKIIMNKIYNFLNKKIDDSILKSLKNTKYSREFINLINTLPYMTIRKLYFYLYEN